MIDSFQFIDTGAHSGAWNMAFDIERAHGVDAGFACSMVRVYQWEPWCISLGRNQSVDEIDVERIHADGLDVVQRPTGGRAILHAEELTYCVVMPADGRGIMDVYKIIGEALISSLRSFVPEIEMTKSQPNFQKLYKEPGSIPCFASSARYEIEFKGRKLVGSAQRHIGKAVLQHGSILLGDSHLRLADYLSVDEETEIQLRHDMELSTISLGNILGRQISFEEIKKAIFDGFEKEWNIRFTVVPNIDYILR